MFNVKVEYGEAPVRHIAVQCPECKKWFKGRDITYDPLTCAHQIDYAEFQCPLCNKKFGGIMNSDRPNVKVASYPDVYNECLCKKEVWV